MFLSLCHSCSSLYVLFSIWISQIVIFKNSDMIYIWGVEVWSRPDISQLACDLTVTAGLQRQNWSWCEPKIGCRMEQPHRTHSPEWEVNNLCWCILIYQPDIWYGDRRAADRCDDHMWPWSRNAPQWKQIQYQWQWLKEIMHCVFFVSVTNWMLNENRRSPHQGLLVGTSQQASAERCPGLPTTSHLWPSSLGPGWTYTHIEHEHIITHLFRDFQNVSST